MQYKKQHYLPFVYLKEFSEDRTADRKRSYIWRAGGTHEGRVRTAKECFENFYNSAKDPKGAEEMFGQYEQAYGLFAEMISQRGIPRNQNEYLGPFVLMINLHARNRSYQNRTAEERVHVYQGLEREVFNLMVPGMAPDAGLPEMAKELMGTWRILMLTSGHGSFITSDNPAHLYGGDDDERPTLMTLPVSPTVCAVAYNCHRWEVQPQSVTEGDWLRLNSAQAGFCYGAIFSNSSPTADEKTSFLKVIADRTPPPGFVDDENWQPNHVRLRRPFDFLRSLKTESAS